MKYVTELMEKVFSDSTPEEYREAVERCFAEATAANGKTVTIKTPHGDIQGVLKDDGTVEITDGNNGEVTTAQNTGDGVQLSGNPPADAGNQQAPAQDQSQQVTPQTSQVPQDQKKAPQAPDPNQGQTKTQCNGGNCQTTNQKFSDPTLPDVEIKTPSFHGKGTEVTTERNRSTAPDSVKVSIEEAITDPDKAGMHKNYSLVFSGFNSVEEAEQAFSEMNNMYSDLDEYENAFSELSELSEEGLTFSEDEMAKLGEMADATADATAKLGDCTPSECVRLASDIKSMSETIRAYSTLAENLGYDMGDTIESMNTFSEIADEAQTEAISNMDINEYFSDFEEEDFERYFSNLDEVESEVLYSALEDEDNTYTFSEIEEVIDRVYSNLALEQNVNEYFSESTEDEVNEFFSDLNEDELNAVYSVLEDENATFSDLNAAIELSNTPLVELFSNASEDELKSFSENVGEELADMAFSLAQHDENATYSDFVNFAEELYTFSDPENPEGEDAGAVTNLAELEDAMKDAEENGDVPLARKVKVLCASMSAAIPEDIDNETLLYCKSAYDDLAEHAKNFLYSHGIEDETFDEIDTDGDGEISKSEWVKAGGSPEEFDALDSNNDGEISREEFNKADKNHDGMISKNELNEIIKKHSTSSSDNVDYSDVEDNSLYSDPNFETDETRVFATVEGAEGYTTTNSCLTSVIN